MGNEVIISCIGGYADRIKTEDVKILLQSQLRHAFSTLPTARLALFL
jgi:hypothetical protein